MAKGRRAPIPRDVAAAVLFSANRTCCVCRQPGKKVQIHHIDGDPGNNEPRNLAVVCTECHDDTQLSGGFGRKLDADQVVLYRDDWDRTMARARARAGAADASVSGDEPSREIELDLATSLAEAYRENGEFFLLAVFYDSIGNVELRDKYIEQMLANEPSDEDVIYLREMQGRFDLVPGDVVARERERLENIDDLLQKARFYTRIGATREAIRDYALGIVETLEEGNAFSAAFYLKEVSESRLVEALFREALNESEAESDLWWQVRALEELGWTSELNALLLESEPAIKESRDPSLLERLAAAQGDLAGAAEIRKEIAKHTRAVRGKNELLVWQPSSMPGEDAEESGTAGPS